MTSSASGAESNKAAAERGSPAAESAAAEGGEHNMGAMAGDIVYLKTEMKRLKNIVETHVLIDDVVDEEKAIETPYLPSTALKNAGAPSNSTVDEMAGRDAAVDDVAVVDELETGGDESAAAPTAAAKKKKKKKKKKRAKAKGRGAKVWNWCHGNSTKITVVGSLAVVLLVSATFGQGLLGDQFPSLRKGADPTRSLSGADTGAPPSNNAPEVSDAASTPLSAEQPSSSIKSSASVVPSTSLQPVSSSLDGCMSDPNNCGCKHTGLADYRGSINITENGDACMRWDELYTSRGVLLYTQEYPDAGLEENFCRNPDGGGRAWCQIVEDYWGYCDVPTCEALCSLADPENCGCSILRQEDYRGSINTTISGYTCQRWDNQTHHTDDVHPANNPGKGLEGNNYCRNPTGKPEGAWCHTTDPKNEWEHCAVPYCGEDPRMAAERRALLQISAAANGELWFNKQGWDEWQYAGINYCEWHGVTCNDETPRFIIELDLSNNGMSGTLSKSIGNLRSLKRLILGGNNIGGTIPTEIGYVSDLEELDLSHNSFEGSAPRFSLDLMSSLVLLHLHANKLTGSVDIAAIDDLFGEPSFVADCGEPSMLEKPIICKGCTMCCNRLGLCAPIGNTWVDEWGFKDFLDFTSNVFLGTVVGLACAMAVSSLLYDKCKSRISPRRMNRSASGINREEEYALKTIGKDSVYKFFLGSSWGGWTIALATIGAQIWVLVPFLKGADLVYSWQCPPGNERCSDMNEGDVTLQGWVLFAILTAAHLLKDIINGSKMIILSGKEMDGGWSRVRYFFGGFCMLFITSFTLYVSAIYNKATATSNTDLIINSVIILFVITIDEYMFAILETMSPRGVEHMSSQVQEQGQETHLVSAAVKCNEEGLEELKQQNEELKEKVERVESEIDDLRSQLDLLTQGRVDATVAQATQGSEGDGASDESDD